MKILGGMVLLVYQVPVRVKEDVVAEPPGIWNTLNPSRFRDKGKIVLDAMEQYTSVGSNDNVKAPFLKRKASLEANI